MKRLYLALIFLGIALPLQSFFSRGTLATLQACAAQLPEYPDADNDDWLDPVYVAHRQSLQPAWWQRIFKTVKVAPAPIWAPADFKQALQAVSGHADMDGVMDVAGIATPATGTLNIVIWSDIHAAFHSLVRSLTDLHTQGIISDDLKILHDNYYLVFNGNVVDGSPYILETLTLVFTLMARNQGKVLFIRGMAEDKKRWEPRGLARQLREVYGAGPANTIPLGYELNTYFAGLPHAVYIAEKNTSNAVRISSPEYATYTQAEGYLDGFFTRLSPEKLTNYSFATYIVTSPPEKIVAVLEGGTPSFWQDRNKEVSPLHYKVNKEGLPVWTFVCPQVRSYRQLYRFFYDAYGVMSFSQSIADATLNLHARDVRDAQEPFAVTCYNLVSGQVVGVAPAAGLRA